MKRILLSVLILILCFPPSTFADEGMWTFDNPPLKVWKEKYQFEPSKEWMEHLRLSTVKVGNVATGSFVSPDGLIMTNQHVGHDAVAKLSSAERDLVKNGFYAGTREAELKCPDLDVSILVSLVDGCEGSGHQAKKQTTTSGKSRAFPAKKDSVSLFHLCVNVFG